jgi:hypothetical protein
VTFHTLLSPPRFDSAAFTKALLSFQWRAAGRVHAGYRRHRLLSRGLARHLRRIQQSKQVSAIVHNHRDLFDARYLYGIGNVFDHPLAFLGNAEADSIRSRASRQSLPMLATLPTDAVLIGVFGFLNEYKGFRIGRITQLMRVFRYLEDEFGLA